MHRGNIFRNGSFIPADYQVGDLNGDMSFNICIRTLLKTNNFYEYGIGGGIVWDSNAEDEWHEAQHKSKILEPLL